MKTVYTQNVDVSRKDKGLSLVGPGAKIGPSGSTTQVGSADAPVKITHIASYVESLADRRVIGGRLDGVWVLDDTGECKTRLLKMDAPCRLDQFRITPDGRRIVWALLRVSSATQ